VELEVEVEVHVEYRAEVQLPFRVTPQLRLRRNV